MNKARSQQSSSWTFTPDGSNEPLDMHIVICLELPGNEPDVDLSIELQYEPKAPEEFQDALHQSMYDGVHDGVAGTGATLPSNGAAVRITEFHTKPGLESGMRPHTVDQICKIARTVIAETTCALWLGLIAKTERT